jgi:quercetin dioxygenase-like cupin family protein
MQLVEVAAGSEWSFESEKDSTLFIYILQGEGSCSEQGVSCVPGVETYWHL